MWWFVWFVVVVYGIVKLCEFYLVICGVGYFDLVIVVYDVFGIDVVGLFVCW